VTNAISVDSKPYRFANPLLKKINVNTVKPVLKEISRVQNIFLLKPGFHLIKIYFAQRTTKHTKKSQARYKRLTTLIGRVDDTQE
jgi:hypothetical protein